MIDLATLPHCAVYGKPVLAGLHVYGDLGVFLAYLAIPIAIEVVRRRKNLHYNGLAILFATFIAACGLGHLLDAWAMTTASPMAYWLEGINEAFTAIVSLFTAYYAFTLVPTLVKLPLAPEWELMKIRIKIYEDRERQRQGLAI